MRGAGGTPGGDLEFWVGVLMMIGGFYLLLSSIVVRASWGLGHSLYSFGGFGITSGMIMIPFLFGVGMVFYNSRNILGWLLGIGSVAALIFGVIASARFSLRSMSAFDIIVILVLAFGGIGLVLKSLRPHTIKDNGAL